jgi:tRNA threonylcarbamoyladenosine biosynthesis protein TsaB
VLACDADGHPLAHAAEDVGHGHTRRLAPLVRGVLERAGLEARALRWVAADLGPGSFTGIRVGLATAEALALASSARMLGASSLAALALGSPARRALLVPLVPAGRRDLYAGWFRADTRGRITLLAAPEVGPVERVLIVVDELHAALGEGHAVRFIGPGAAREQEALERRWPSSTSHAWRHDGLSALDLAAAARLGRGPAAGLPKPEAALTPLYVRPAQAEERVRHRALAAVPITLREFREDDLEAVAALELAIFSDPWPASFFHSELRQPMVYARVAEREGRLAGYQMAWLGAGTGHLANMAVAPDQRRRGIARALMDDLLARARAAGSQSVTLEVRVSNFAAQGLYRGYGFRVAGVRRGYYRDTGEDALLMEWRAPASFPTGV